MQNQASRPGITTAIASLGVSAVRSREPVHLHQVRDFTCPLVELEYGFLHSVVSTSGFRMEGNVEGAACSGRDLFRAVVGLAK